jgi:diguanylate cyclase (GGDEF)-like protein
MPDSKLNILIADDDEGDRRQVRRVLRQAGLACECIETASIEGALEACDKCAFDCAIVDYRMPGHDGLHGIAALHERHPYMPIIMATGEGDEIVATEAMKRGASDYIPKMHIHAESMRRVIESALEKAVLRRKAAQQRQELENFASVLVQDLKALEVKVHEARIDHLTGLAGRPLFLEQAAALRVRSANGNLATAILFIDLDGFKAVNDRFGHDHGDAVLVQTAKVLRTSVRDTDIAGRVGGDEFVVCLAAPSEFLELTATKVAGRIVKKIAEIGRGIGCSVGIALTGTDTVDIETAIRQADEAMYAAKKSGKNRFMIHGRPRTPNILIADDDEGDRKQVRCSRDRQGLHANALRR